MTKLERIKEIIAQNQPMLARDIARMVNCSEHYVRTSRWRIQNPDYNARYMQERRSNPDYRRREQDRANEKRRARKSDAATSFNHGDHNEADNRRTA